MPPPGHTEIPDDWIQDLSNSIATDPTALKAWKGIEGVGLNDAALFLLWGYACGAQPDLIAMHRRTEDATDRLKAANREQVIAKTNLPRRAYEADLFHSRAIAARETAMRSKWPTPSADAPTLGDKLTKISKETGRQSPLPAVAKALTKAAGKRSHVNTFYFLFLLQGYAATHGLQLGNKRLVALAHCAYQECLPPALYARQGSAGGDV